jgi:ribonuclease-3
LGDAVLDFVTGEYLYHRFPELAEGPLTSLRSALVRRETLARFAIRFDLGYHMLMGHGEAESGGRERPALLCASFEALVGAIHLDQGLDAVRSVVEPLIGPEIECIMRDRSHKDAKSELQELAQARLRRTPRYKTVAESGPDHAKEFTVEVSIGREVYGRGIGPSKQHAAQAAAQEAFDRLEAEDQEA